MAEVKDAKVLSAKEREKAIILRFSIKKSEDNVAALKEIVGKEKQVVTLTVV